MVTKAQILSIDYVNNTCLVRMPIFESAAGGDKAIATAIFSNTPGIYNGYKENDVVLVAFENGQMEMPCVIGKLYLGVNTENNTPRGVINCENLLSNNLINISVDTKISIDNLENTAISKDGINKYKTIKNVLDAVANNTSNIEQLKDSAQTGSSWGTAMCTTLLKNIYGTEITGYSLESAPATEEFKKGFFYLLYNGQKTLTDPQVKSYMLFMTGHEILPNKYDPKVYNGVLMTLDKKIYCPVWDKTNSYLKLITIVDEASETILEVTDLSGNETTVKTGTEAAATDATDEAHKTITSNKISVNDLS